MINRPLLTPFRNFFCQECGADFDTFRASLECPVCGSERVSECPDEDDEIDFGKARTPQESEQ